MTEVPTGPLVGLKPVTFGAPTVNRLAPVPVPLLVVTVINPEVAPAGTVVVICPSVSTVYGEAGMPLNFTALAPVKPIPLITTVAPVNPAVGVNPVTVGPPATVKFGVPRLTVLAVPPAVITVIGPVVAPAGTVATSDVLVQVVVAGTPLNFTLPPDCVAPKLAPVIVTDVPTEPFVGLNPVMPGAGAETGNVVSI